MEAKFSKGKVARMGDVRILDGDNNLLETLQLGEDGTASVPLVSVDHSRGLLIDVDTSSHDNYWIVKREDIGSNCGS